MIVCWTESGNICVKLLLWLDICHWQPNMTGWDWLDWLILTSCSIFKLIFNSIQYPCISGAWKLDTYYFLHIGLVDFILWLLKLQLHWMYSRNNFKSSFLNYCPMSICHNVNYHHHHHLCCSHLQIFLMTEMTLLFLTITSFASLEITTPGPRPGGHTDVVIEWRHGGDSRIVLASEYR